MYSQKKAKQIKKAVAPIKVVKSDFNIGVKGEGFSVMFSADRKNASSMIRAKRVPHVMGVEEEAVRLAERLGRRRGDGPPGRYPPRLHQVSGTG